MDARPGHPVPSPNAALGGRDRGETPFRFDILHGIILNFSTLRQGRDTSAGNGYIAGRKIEFATARCST
jgi:hypothetical protein